MSSRGSEPDISIVVPLYNEAESLPLLYGDLTQVLQAEKRSYELLFVDDGSRDSSQRVLHELAAQNDAIRIIRLVRNFGKEVATTAGIHAASGRAIITLDADGQHPVTALPNFIAAWEKGAKVVIGKRSTRQASLVKRTGSKIFYGIFRKLTGIPMDQDSSDFRLIDREVQQAFNNMTERNRITRGLIDWLGYEHTYVPYVEKQREAGTATYSLRKLVKLAVDSAISLSISPLYIVAYIGAVVLPFAALLGVTMVLNAIVGDPFDLNITGGAYVLVLMLFLVGVVLVSQGIIGLYLSHIHAETQNRPLYVIDKAKSKGMQ